MGLTVGTLSIGNPADGDQATRVIGPEASLALYENSPDGVLFTVPDGTVLAVNPAACQILGRTEAEICSLGRQGMADQTDKRWTTILEERERTGSARGVARMIRGDGVAVEVEMSAKVFHDAHGAERACTIIRDVTDRVRMERELRDSRERLAEAERVAQIGSWEWDIARDRVNWSDGLFHIYGLTAEEFDPTRDGAEKRVYPDDRQRVRDTLQKAITARSSFTLEYRAVRTDGRVRTLRNRGEVVVDEAGEPIRVVGIAQDITDAELAREALQSTSSELERRAAELQKLALSSSAEPTPVSYAPLTSRQLEILRLVAKGLTSAQIAERLFLTEATVKWHVKQILTKTASSNRAEAVARVLGAER
ncbi:MAG: PAS domain S-box protein [Solirubrobacteraceae bacterium]